MTARYKPGFYVILLVILMASVPSINAMATTVAIPETTLPAGSYATLSVTIHDMQDYGTGTIGISFDPAVVHVTSVTSGPHSTVVDWNHDNSSGTVIISAWNIDGVSGDIVFANVTFHSVGSSGTSTALNLNVTTLNDITYKDIPIAISNGSFRVKAEGVTHTSPASTSTSTSTLTPPIQSLPTGASPPPASTATPAPTPTIQPTSTPTPAATVTGVAKTTPTPTVKTPGFEFVFTCFALLSAFLVLLLIRLQRGDSR